MHILPTRAGCSALLTLLLAGCVTSQQSSEPANLSDAKAAVIAYEASGAYARDLREVSDRAIAWIEDRSARKRPGERLAVVMDIDETVLSNLPNMLERDFGYVPTEWERWVERAEAPALPAARDIYKSARRQGVAVLFLTGRRDPNERPGTVENLRKEGMGDYAELRMAPPIEPEGTTARERKRAVREAWVADGWTLIASIGDQESDLGPPAERSFKLPNPFYRIP